MYNLAIMAQQLATEIAANAQQQAGQAIASKQTLTQFPVEKNTLAAFISNAEQIEYRKFEPGAYTGPRLADFVQRINGYIAATDHLINDKSEFSAAEQTALTTNFAAKIQKDLKGFDDPYQELTVLELLFQRSVNSDNQSDLPKLRKEYLTAKKKYLANFTAKNHFAPEQAQAVVAARLKAMEAKIIRNAVADKDSVAYQKRDAAYEQALRASYRVSEQYVAAAQKKFIRYLHNTVFPRLLVTFKQADEPYLAALTRLRRAEANYMTSCKAPILLNDFPPLEDVPGLEDKRFFDLQIPIGYFTDAQLRALGVTRAEQDADTNSSYKRDSEGLSGLKIQAIGYINEGGQRVILGVFARHGSPVPILLNDEVQRLLIIQRNAEQVTDNLANVLLKSQAVQATIATGEFASNEAGKYLTTEINAYQQEPLVVPSAEIRLLSVHAKKFNNVHGFREQKQYQQIWETYFGFSMQAGQTSTATLHGVGNNAAKFLVKTDTMAVSLGVNAVRHKFMSDQLRAWLTNRVFNQTYEAIETKIPQLLDNKKLTEQATALLKSIAASMQPLEPKEQKKFARQLEAVRLGRSELNSKYVLLQKNLQEYEAFTAQLPETNDATVRLVIDRRRAALGEVIKQQNVELVSYLAKHHKAEKALNNLRRKLWQQHKHAIKFKLTELAKTVKDTADPQNDNYRIYEFGKSYVDTLDLAYGKVFGETFKPWERGNQSYKSKNNYQLQTALGDTLAALDRVPFSGCIDDIDRGGRYSVTFETRKIASFFQITDKLSLNRLLRHLAQYSVSLNHSEASRAKGAKGFQIGLKDGNEMLDLSNVAMAKLGKDPYRHAPDRTAFLPAAQADRNQALQTLRQKTEGRSAEPNPVLPAASGEASKAEPTIRPTKSPKGKEKVSEDEMSESDEISSAEEAIEKKPEQETMAAPTTFSTLAEVLSPAKPAQKTPQQVAEEFTALHIGGILYHNPQLLLITIERFAEKFTEVIESLQTGQALPSTFSAQSGLPPKNPVQDKTKLAALQKLQTNSPALYERLVNQFSHAISGNEFLKFAEEKPAFLNADEQIELERVKKINAMLSATTNNQIIKETQIQQNAPSLLKTENWLKASQVGWLFIGSKRSQATAAVDQLVALVEHADKNHNQQEKTAALLHLFEAINEWNQYHRKLGLSSRRTAAMAALQEQTAQQISLECKIE